jgi:hypothetical protein
METDQEAKPTEGLGISMAAIINTLTGKNADIRNGKNTFSPVSGWNVAVYTVGK